MSVVPLQTGGRKAEPRFAEPLTCPGAGTHGSSHGSRDPEPQKCAFPSEGEPLRPQRHIH